MPNTFFQFKQFTIHQDKCAMKVTTDACLFGAFVAAEVRSMKSDERSKKTEVRSVLEIGTGTGLLSLMVAQQHPSVTIDTIEIDRDAAEQAKENIQSSPWNNRIQVINADAREYPYSKKYDCIISNPPFYEKELKGDNAQKNIAHHNEGLLLDELLLIIRNNLEATGRFFLLLPYKRQENLKQLLLKHEMIMRKLLFVRQSVNHDYFRIMLEGQLNGSGISATQIEEMTVKDVDDEYTAEFTGLLKEYYLKL